MTLMNRLALGAEVVVVLGAPLVAGALAGQALEPRIAFACLALGLGLGAVALSALWCHAQRAALDALEDEFADHWTGRRP